MDAENAKQENRAQTADTETQPAGPGEREQDSYRMEL